MTSVDMVNSLLESFDKFEEKVEPMTTKLQHTEGWIKAFVKVNKAIEEFAVESTKLNAKGDGLIEKLNAELRQLGQNVADAITAAETLEIEIEDLQNTCQRLKENICRQEEAKEKIKEDAMSSCVALQNISTSIAHQRKLLYLITRLTWDEKAFKKNLIKGYVFDHVRNDVAVFETDAKKTQQNCSTMVSDFLWDYIGGGVNPAWKKQQK